MSEKYAKIGEMSFAKMEKVNAELLALMYGALVGQIVQDFEHDIEKVNDQLDKMGMGIGTRMADEFFATTGIPYCQNFRDTAEVIAKVGFKMFLGLSADVVKWNHENNSCYIVLQENPLNEYVQLTPKLKGTLWYSNLLCGIIRGCLEQLQLKVECKFVKDKLRGDEQDVIRLQLLEVLAENFKVK